MKWQLPLKVLIVYVVLTVDSRVPPEEPEGQSFIHHVNAVSKKISKNTNEDLDSDMERHMKIDDSVSSRMVQTRANTSSKNGEGHHSGSAEVLNTDANDNMPLITRKGKGTTRMGGCAAGEELVGGQCLTFSPRNSGLNWQDATDACRATAGRRLVIPADPAALLDYVVDTYGTGKAYSAFWVGGSDIEEEGVFKWSNGVSIGNLPWGTDQPNNYHGNQDCLEVNWLGGYNDRGCGNENKRRYICESVCAAGEILVGGQCLTFGVKPLTWQNATDACSEAGGRLATLEDPAALLEYIVATYGSGMHLWVGGSDIEEEGMWKWSNGVSIGNLTWGLRQPDNYGGNQDCLEVYSGRGYNDRECDMELRYMCEPGCFFTDDTKSTFKCSGSNVIYNFFYDECDGWKDFESACSFCDKGAFLALPADNIAAKLRNFIMANYGEGPVWVAGKGVSGTKLENIYNHQQINTNLWGHGQPGQPIPDDSCMTMLAIKALANGDPFFTFNCQNRAYVLCQDTKPENTN